MSDLERLQVDVVRTMEAQSYFADIPCFWLRPRVQSDGSVQTVPEIQSAIDSALAGLTTKASKSGVAVTVLMPTLECPDPAEVGPPIELSLALLVEEIPFVNMDATTGTRKSAEDIVLELLPLFHLREFQPNTVLLADRKAAEPMLDPASGKLTYEVRFRSRFRFGAQTLCGKPFISGAAASVTLSSGTAGASIYYSTDESFPRFAETIGGAGATGSTLYTAPFTVDAGTVVRAAAYKTGTTASHVTQKTIA
jgi:hypothetical protein